MHVRDGGLSVGLVEVEDVSCAAIHAGLFVDRKIEVVNVAVLAKDLAEVVLVNILGQPLDNNLCRFR